MTSDISVADSYSPPCDGFSIIEYLPDTYLSIWRSFSGHFRWSATTCCAILTEACLVSAMTRKVRCYLISMTVSSLSRPFARGGRSVDISQDRKARNLGKLSCIHFLFAPDTAMLSRLRLRIYRPSSICMYDTK